MSESKSPALIYALDLVALDQGTATFGARDVVPSIDGAQTTIPAEVWRKLGRPGMIYMPIVADVNLIPQEWAKPW